MTDMLEMAMKTYTVEADFKGRVKLTVRAESRAAATKIFEETADEDDMEILTENDCQIDWDTMKEKP